MKLCFRQESKRREEKNRRKEAWNAVKKTFLLFMRLCAQTTMETWSFYCKIDKQDRDATAAPVLIIAAYSCFDSLLRFTVFPRFVFAFFLSPLDAITCCSRRDRQLPEKKTVSEETWTPKRTTEIAVNASWGKLKDHSCISQTHFEVGWVEVLAERFVGYFEDFLKDFVENVWNHNEKNCRGADHKIRFRNFRIFFFPFQSQWWSRVEMQFWNILWQP